MRFFWVEVKGVLTPEQEESICEMYELDKVDEIMPLFALFNAVFQSMDYFDDTLILASKIKLLVSAITTEDKQILENYLATGHIDCNLPEEVQKPEEEKDKFLLN